jgi:hypothetical protein
MHTRVPNYEVINRYSPSHCSLQVESLTGRPLTADAWVSFLAVPVEDKVKKEKEAYEKAVKEGAWQIEVV